MAQIEFSPLANRVLALTKQRSRQGEIEVSLGRAEMGRHKNREVTVFSPHSNQN